MTRGPAQKDFDVDHHRTLTTTLQVRGCLLKGGPENSPELRSRRNEWEEGESEMSDQ